MDLTKAITLRSKKLGVLMRSARNAAGKSKRECGDAIGVSSAMVSSMESGRRSPSLPQLELLSHFLRVSLEYFWRDDLISATRSLADTLHVEHNLSLRDRFVGAALAAAREKNEYTYKDIKEETGISSGRLKRYESGDNSVPLPELELLIRFYRLHLSNFIDPENVIGQWLMEQRAIIDFRQLSPELQEFVSQPINRPYLELAMRLSKMSTDDLRAVAEGLLEITI